MALFQRSDNFHRRTQQCLISQQFHSPSRRIPDDDERDNLISKHINSRRSCDESAYVPTLSLNITTTVRLKTSNPIQSFCKGSLALSGIFFHLAGFLFQVAHSKRIAPVQYSTVLSPRLLDIPLTYATLAEEASSVRSTDELSSKPSILDLAMYSSAVIN